LVKQSDGVSAQSDTAKCATSPDDMSAEPQTAVKFGVQGAGGQHELQYGPLNWIIIYEGESNENLKSAIKIRNTARLSCKLTTVILMV
jgi:hypothetical protein